MPAAKTLPRILHLHSSFNAGGKELRAVRLMNAFVGKAEHTVVSAAPGEYEAAQRVAKGVRVAYPKDFPALTGLPTPGRMHKLARAMQDFDLVLTYNWGAMDAVMAHTLFAASMGLPALIHHEDGFNADEIDGLKARRNWYRRVALGRSAAVVVPSTGLFNTARHVWHQPEARVHLIPNGIPVARFRKRPKPDNLPRLVKRKGEKWVGTLAGLRKVKNLPRLVRVFAPLPEEWQLVIVGDGPEREAIVAEAERLDVRHRVHLPGPVDDPAKAMGLFDIFALSSDTEQFPLSVVEAMAAGLPVAAPSLGDIPRMVADDNADLMGSAGDEEALSAALARLAREDTFREALGLQNRKRAAARYDEADMIAAYRSLYARFLPGAQVL